MRSIEVKSWTVVDNEKKEHSEDTLMLLSLLVMNQDPTTLPKGFESFKLFTRLTRAFEKAQESKTLVLEEDVYKFLKNNVEKNVPSMWGANSNIVNALTLFMDAKEE